MRIPCYNMLYDAAQGLLRWVPAGEERVQHTRHPGTRPPQHLLVRVEGSGSSAFPGSTADVGL